MQRTEATGFPLFAMTMPKNNKLGKLVKPTSQCIIASTIKPLGTF